MSNVKKVDLCDGKYTVIIKDEFKVSALRNSKPWRSEDEFVGDGLILAMASNLIEQQEVNKEMYSMLEGLKFGFSCQCGHPRCRKEETKREIEALLAKARGEL